MKRILLLSLLMVGLSSCEIFNPSSPTPPPPPTNLKATPDNAQVTLTWEPSSGSNVAGYRVYRSTNFTVATDGTLLNPDLVTGNEYTDLTAANGTTYYYMVTAVDASGRMSLGSNVVSETPGTPVLVAPTGLVAIPFNGQIMLNWDAGEEPGVAGYHVYRSLTAAVDTGGTPLNPEPLETTSFIDTGLDNGVTYFYAVTAVDANGNQSAASNIANATPQDTGEDRTPPAAPQNLTALPGDAQVELNWSENEEPDLEGYNIYRSLTATVDISGEPLNAGLWTDSNYTDRTVTNGTTYAYAVTAVDASGNESAPSNVVSALPVPMPDGRPSVTESRPADGETNVVRNESVATSLDLPNGGVDPTTLSSETVRLLRTSDGAPVAALVNTSGGFDTIILTPVDLLEANTSYRFEVTEAVRDESGAAFIPYSITFTTGTDDGRDPGLESVAFEKVALPTANDVHYTSLAIGPDGKLYASALTGQIRRFPILADGTLGAAEDIDSLVTAEGGLRLLIGLTFDPASTPGNLIVWVSHTQFAFSGSNPPEYGDDWTGKITRLSGPNLEVVQDYVVGLPRSAKDHVTNSIAFGPDGAMYVPQGANSAMGAADSTWRNRPERLLSAAVLRIDTSAITSPPLDVKTEEGGSYNPFAPGAPVTVYASGVRNAYDLVWHSNGQLYVPTNGSAAGGNTPGTPASLPASCQSRIDAGIHGPYTGPQASGLTNVRQTMPDFMFRVVENGYYGHPNPTRCEWILNGANPTAGADPAQVDTYPVGTAPDRNYRGFAFDFGLNPSTNGIIEYQNNAFDGALQGKMLIVRFSKFKDIIVLTPGGAADEYNIVTSNEGVEGLTSFLDPLALIENPANGYLYVSEFNRGVSGLSLADAGDELGPLSMLQPNQRQTGPRLTLLRPINP